MRIDAVLAVVALPPKTNILWKKKEIERTKAASTERGAASELVIIISKP